MWQFILLAALWRTVAHAIMRRFRAHAADAATQANHSEMAAS
jgi:hypothetical protein